MTIYNIKKVNGKRKRVWNTGRCRGIKDAQERLGNITGDIDFLLKKKDRVRVLEVGCGYGRALLELRKQYGDRVETFGINLEPRWNQNLTRIFGLAEKIFDKSGIDENLPKVLIADAGKGLAFPRNYFDYVFAQATVQYIHDKAHFLEEVNRVLTPVGLARIEVQDYKKRYDKPYKNIFEIHKGNKIIPFRDYIKRFPNLEISTSKTHDWTILRMKKSSAFKLRLKLTNSFALEPLNKGYWGTKAIYETR